MLNDKGKQENEITEKIIVERKYTNVKFQQYLILKIQKNNLIFIDNLPKR